MYTLTIKVLTKSNLRFTLETIQLDETETPFESPAYFELVDNCILNYNELFEIYKRSKELYFLPEEHRLLNPSNINDVFHCCSLAKKKKKKPTRQYAESEASEEEEYKFIEPFGENCAQYWGEVAPADYVPPKPNHDFG